MCNTYCCYTATMVVRKRINITLYVHGLTCNIDASAFAKGNLRYSKIKKIK